MVQPQFKGQTYGEATKQRKAVQAVPTATAPTDVAAQRAARTARPLPSGSLVAASGRPTEPITAGANFGPGPNALGAGIPLPPASSDNAIEELKAIYQLFPNDDLADLLDSAIREGY